MDHLNKKKYFVFALIGIVLAALIFPWIPRPISLSLDGILWEDTTEEAIPVHVTLEGQLQRKTLDARIIVLRNAEISLSAYPEVAELFSLGLRKEFDRYNDVYYGFLSGPLFYEDGRTDSLAIGDMWVSENWKFFVIRPHLGEAEGQQIMSFPAETLSEQDLWALLKEKAAG